MTTLLKAHNLSFAYDGRPILRGVGLSIAAGEFVGLIGANGSGKTTLLRALLGLLSAKGEVELCGAKLKTLTRREIALRATMVRQDTQIDFAFTAREIVAMGRTPYLGRFSPETAADRDAITRAMMETETLDFAERAVTELSGGERQRVHLARALAQQTKIILLDEPTANLDLAHQFEALQLVRNFTRSGGGALAAIHDLALAARFCDRVLMIADGLIVAAGAPDEVLSVENLRRYFNIDVRITRDGETGEMIVFPLMPSTNDLAKQMVRK